MWFPSPLSPTLHFLCFCWFILKTRIWGAEFAWEVLGQPDLLAHTVVILHQRAGADEDLGAAGRGGLNSEGGASPGAPAPQRPSAPPFPALLTPAWRSSPAWLPRLQEWAPSLGKSLGLHTHWPLCPERHSVSVLASASSKGCQRFQGALSGPRVNCGFRSEFVLNRKGFSRELEQRPSCQGEGSFLLGDLWGGAPLSRGGPAPRPSPPLPTARSGRRARYCSRAKKPRRSSSGTCGSPGKRRRKPRRRPASKSASTPSMSTSTRTGRGHRAAITVALARDGGSAGGTAGAGGAGPGRCFRSCRGAAPPQLIYMGVGEAGPPRSFAWARMPDPARGLQLPQAY